MLTASNVVVVQFGALDSFSLDVVDASPVTIVKPRSSSPIPPRVEVPMRLDNSPEAPTRGGVHFSNLEAFGMDGIECVVPEVSDVTVPAVHFGALDSFNLDGPPMSSAIEVDVAFNDGQVAPLPNVPFAGLEPLDLGVISSVPPRRPADSSSEKDEPAAAGGIPFNHSSQVTGFPEVSFARLEPLDLSKISSVPPRRRADPAFEMNVAAAAGGDELDPGMSGPAAAASVPSTPFKSLILLEQTLEEVLVLYKPGENILITYRASLSLPIQLTHPTTLLQIMPQPHPLRFYRFIRL